MPSSDEKLGIHPFRSEHVLWRDMDLPATPEDDAPDAWGYQFKKFDGLQKLEMEFETIKPKSGQLDAVVQHAPAWRFDLGDGRVLTTDGLPVVQSTGLGLGDKHVHHPAISEYQEETNLLRTRKATFEQVIKDAQMAKDAAREAQDHAAVREGEGSVSGPDNLGQVVGDAEIEDHVNWIHETRSFASGNRRFAARVH